MPDVVQFVDSIGTIFAPITATLTNPATNGWPNADTGQPFLIDGGAAAEYSGTGGRGVHTLPTPAIAHASYIDTDLADASIVCSFVVDQLALTQPIAAGAVLRRVDTSNFYLVEVRCNTNQTISVHIFKVVAGVFTELANATSGSTHTITGTFWLRFETQDGVLRARVWTNPNPEPTTWTVIVGSQLDHVSGDVGLRSRTVAGNTNTNPTVRYDNLSVTPLTNLRLDLNDDVTWSLNYEGTDLSPPPLKVARVSNLMTDGESEPASAHTNRRLVLMLDLKTPTVDGQGAELQRLWRELDRPFNFIKWQPAGVALPVFFTTLRSMDTQVTDWPGAGDFRTLKVTITAKPYGRGLRETVTPATVSNDPAAASNGCFWDITGVKGDVQAPLVLKRPTTNVGVQSLFAVRRRGTPSGVPFLLQAESMTLGADTTTQPNSATFSGSGNNFTRTTFSGTPGWATRLSVTNYPSSPSVDARGQYRLFARVRKNGATGIIQMRLVIEGAIQDVAAIAAATTTVHMVDLGLVSIPASPDPVYDGPTGLEIPTRGPLIEVQAQRASGTDTLDTDDLLWVPADDRLAIVQWPTDISPADRLVLDGEHNLTYASAGDVVSSAPGYHVAPGLPMLSPGVTNRIFMINEVGAGLAEPAFPTTWVFEGHYWPRYLHVRSVSS